MKAIINANVVLKDKILANHTVIFNDKIIEIKPSEHVEYSFETIDGKELYLIPGLIDQHIHGYMGYDAMDSDVDGLKDMAQALLANGVTGFLPTTVTMDNNSIKNCLLSIKAAMESDYRGARILGAYLEGPYLSSEKKGAHEAQYIRKPQKEFVQQFLDIIKIITLAPNQSSDFIAWCTDRGIKVSLGHSAITYDDAYTAFNQGASQVTHLFNGMSGIHHQDPGLAGAALLYPDVKVELIADTIHVRKELFPLIYRTKGAKDIILISDCMRAGGMPPGNYKLGNLDVITDEKSAHLTTGSLAGSILKLNKAIYHFETYASIPRCEAVAMASYNPACNLGIENECGSIERGLRADLVLVNYKMDVKLTIVNGEVVYCL